MLFPVASRESAVRILLIFVRCFNIVSKTLFPVAAGRETGEALAWNAQVSDRSSEAERDRACELECKVQDVDGKGVNVPR